jgi:hypothetical protein
VKIFRERAGKTGKRKEEKEKKGKRKRKIPSSWTPSK